MSNTSNFYVVLPSNGSKQFFPTNTASVFKTHIQEPYQLEGKWEVALAEISYPMTWKLVEKNFHIGLVVAYDEENKGQFNPVVDEVYISWTIGWVKQFMESFIPKKSSE